MIINKRAVASRDFSSLNVTVLVLYRDLESRTRVANEESGGEAGGCVHLHHFFAGTSYTAPAILLQRTRLILIV